MSTTEIDPRDEAAATDYLVPVLKSPGLYTVYSFDGTERTVDLIERVCDCEDYQYRTPDGGCKHIRRILMRIGELPIPPVDGVDPNLKNAREGSD